ncbi:MAG: TIGR02452 family protein [Lachnospiraceae bacterium]|nr:TIGR02452 family protein [Lachnospiraceae bacterium]
MGRDENISVFKDTERLCKTNPKISESVKKATASQKLILEGEPLDDQKKDIYENPAKVVVSKKRTYEAAAGYRGQHVAVHNFASASNPGGGVVNGANAQEECLCRCSGLYFNLSTRAMWDGFYQPHRDAHDPIHNDDIIYTPNVPVFKSDTATPQLMAESDWYDVDVITCAAPNLRNIPSNKYNTGDGNKNVIIGDKDLLALHEKRLRRILEVALSENCDTIILGAFGCGAFQNNPEVVALANRNVIKDYLHAFKNIEFAVYCSPHDERNFKIFERVLKVYCG